MDQPNASTPPPPPVKVRPPSVLRTAVIAGVLAGAIAGGTVGAVIDRGGLGSLLTTKKTANPTATTLTSTGTISLKEESATVDLVTQVSPSVVSIIAKRDFSKVYGQTAPRSPLDDFFGFPFTQPTPVPQGKQEIGGGTGFIATSDGIIITNKHVATIEGADEYTVVRNDGTTYDAKILATDPVTDIAFLKIEAKDLPTIEFGNSDSVQIGETVIAIGNALGEYRNTVTKGIVSGLSRTITAGDGSGQNETLRNVIQTDAAINPGNSGGPLLNLASQAIGINTAINQEGQLIGFALPINLAKADLDSLQRTGKIERPYLGVRYVIINEQVKAANNLTVDYGALVVRGNTRNDLAVVPGSPADKAGLTENDIILEIDGQRITENNDLGQFLLERQVGQTVSLKVLSKGQEKNVSVTLEARSE